MPRFGISRALIRAFIATFLFTGSGSLRAQNLLTNGGFDSGLAGWTNVFSGGGKSSHSLETSLQYAGSKALKTVINHPGADFWNAETRDPT